MNCNPDLLWTAVEQSDDPGPELDAVVRHLESCTACRQTLQGYGGEPTSWDEARRWLEICDADASEPLPRPPIDLSFLDEPAHPEMLGRIGRYDVHGVLGRGGMGVVLRAYDSDLQRSVAVKVMAPEWAASEPARRRFAREAQAAASVAHENVIPIYNVEASATLPYLVMRYVPGATLERWVRSHGPLDAPTILRVAGQMVEGLAAAHRRGLVHRDIKPGNVLVGENIERVWITDFGLARAADSVTLTRTGVIAGTPHYMSPEQARGESIDQRSDLFSLGCVLHFISTGSPPFDAENTLAVLHKIVSQRPASLASLRDDLPPSFVRLVDQLLQRSTERRPADCEAVLASLADAQTEQRQGLVARPPRRRRPYVAAGLLVVAALLAFLVNLNHSPIESSLFPPPAARMGDPWTTSGVSEKVEPYIAQASQQIDRFQLTGNIGFDRELVQLKRRIARLERPLQVAVAPTIAETQRDWDKEMKEILTTLKRLEKD